MGVSDCDWVTEILGAGAALDAGSASRGTSGTGSLDSASQAAKSPEAARLTAHLAGCEACACYALELRRLDELMLSEPTPAPPPELGAWILREVAARRQAELAWARGRLVGATALLIACAFLGLTLSGGLSEGLASWDATSWGAGEWDLSLRAWASLRDGATGVRANLDAWVQSAGLSASAAPASGLWGQLLALGPLLVFLNWAVGRAPLYDRASS